MRNPAPWILLLTIAAAAAAGPDVIVVTRRSGDEQPWLYDLWLAERLGGANSLGSGSRGCRSPV